MEPTEYTMSNQELFFLVAQACWDTFLLFLFSLFITTLFAYAYVGFRHITRSNQG